MDTTTAVLLASALLAAPVAVAGADGFPGLPGQASYGLCQAAAHADGNATAQAPPFQNRTEAEGCHELKPGGEAANGPEQAGNAGAADEDAAAEHRQHDDHRQDDAAREDGRSYGHDRADDHRPDRAGPP